MEVNVNSHYHCICSTFNYVARIKFSCKSIIKNLDTNQVIINAMKMYTQFNCMNSHETKPQWSAKGPLFASWECSGEKSSVTCCYPQVALKVSFKLRISTTIKPTWLHKDKYGGFIPSAAMNRESWCIQPNKSNTFGIRLKSLSKNREHTERHNNLLRHKHNSVYV